MCCILSSLRPLDVEFMKALHEKVNIVPILAKADTLTPSEVKKKKIKASLISINLWALPYISFSIDLSLHFIPCSVSLQIREEIEQYGIKIYQFPDCDSDEDEDFKQQDLQLKVRAKLRWVFFLFSLYFVLSVCKSDQKNTWVWVTSKIEPVCIKDFVNAFGKKHITS